MVMDSDVILGGHMAPYLTEEDLAALHKKVKEKSAFPDEAYFIFLSEAARDSVPVGAALAYVKGFLEEI